MIMEYVAAALVCWMVSLCILPAKKVPGEFSYLAMVLAALFTIWGVLAWIAL